MANSFFGKPTLDPSAPAFSPVAYSEHTLPALTFSPDNDVAGTEECLDNTPLLTWDELSDNPAPRELYSSMDVARCMDSSTEIEYQSDAHNQVSSEKQQRLERLVYLATHDIFVQSLFKSITSLSAGTAKHILKRNVSAEHLEHLLKLYGMHKLVDTIVKMHAERVYSSTPQIIKEKWPWLLNGDISELQLTNFSKSERFLNTSCKSQDNLKRFPCNLGQKAQPSCATTSLLSTNESKPSKTYSQSVLDDSSYTIMSFEPPGEDSYQIDPYNVYFPYPTLRTILKETQCILKSAIYDFAKKYLPEKLEQKAFAFQEASSLGQWVLMVQDAVNEMQVQHPQGEAMENLSHLRYLDSTANLMNAASELHDLVAMRRDISTSGLYVLLTNLLSLVDALEAPEWSKKLRALENYTSALADDLKTKLEEIQGPLRATLRRINDEMEALSAEKEAVSQKYREEEKGIQSHFILNTETLSRILLSQEESFPQVSQTPKDRLTPVDMRNSNGNNTAMLAPPDICVWDPEKQLIDYRPGGKPLHPIAKENETTAFRHPWDTVSIDLAINAFNSKENIHYNANRPQTDVPQKAVPAAHGSRLQKITELPMIVLPPRHSKAIPIKKAEPKKEDPTPKQSRFQPESKTKLEQFDLLIDL